MSDKQLGRLERVDLRDIWLSEATHFTPWLARPENLAVLASTIDMELELEAQEKNVGPFRADILCRDADTEGWVLIENQLEQTNHTHLGQLLTYAAGLQTVTIVWVAKQFTEEHRAALDWLNEITDNRFRFFGLEVELWRIGQSPAAPRFNVVSKPNDWTQSIGRAARSIVEGTSSSETKAMQFRYWQALRAYLEAHAPSIRMRPPRPQHATVFSLGKSGFHLVARVNTLEGRITAELFIQRPDGKALFALLEKQRADIEAAVGEPLSWDALLDRKGCRAALYMNDVDPANEADWPKQHAWLADALGRLDAAFRTRIRALNVANTREEAAAA